MSGKMRTSLLTILALAVIGLLAVLLIPRGQAPSGGPDGKGEIRAQKTERVLAQNADLTSSAFPSGFPTEAGASASSYKYIPANSTEQQFTVQWGSKKSMGENAKIFSDYFTAAGFNVVNKATPPDQVFYYATRDNDVLSVLVQRTSGTSQVSATYLLR